jgi:hypothetical protein
MPSYLDVLGKYREKDQKNPEGQVLPEQETLNSAQLHSYLDKNGFTPDNFDIRFKADTAKEILRQGGTRGGAEMIATIDIGKKHLEGFKKADLLEEKNEAEFHSDLMKELITQGRTDLETPIMNAYIAYHTVRKLAERTIKIRQEFQDQREKEKGGVEKNYQDSFEEVIGDVKKNFGHMSGKEKLLAVGGLAFAGFMLFNSENPKAVKLKNFVVGTLEAGGVALGANYIYKIFSGQTGLEAISDVTKDTIASKGFFSEAFKTDAEKGEILQRSTVYLGDKGFLDLAKKYKEAKASGKKTVEVSGVEEKDMKPEEIYTALDVFFSRYPVAQLEKRFEKSANPPNWTTVVSGVMAEDGKIEIKGNIMERAIDSVQEVSQRTWNGFWVTTEGMGWMRPLYLKIWGKEPTEQELKTGSEKLKEMMRNEKETDAELPTFVEQTFSEDSKKRYKEMLAKPQKLGGHPGIIFNEVENEAVYMESESKLDVTIRPPEQAVQKMFDDALDNAKKFVKEKYPAEKDKPGIGDNFQVYANNDEMRGVRVTRDSSYRLFIRVPIPGSPEFSRKSVMAKPSERKESPHEDIFMPEDKVEYGKMQQWDQEKLRIVFSLDSKQTNEIRAIELWYTDYFKTKGLTRKEVMKALFEDEDLRKRAVAETGINQELKGATDLLHTKDAEITELEKSAAAAFDTTWTDKFNPMNWLKKPSDAYEPLIEQMKRNGGYTLRLAILGDSAAREKLTKEDKYNPEKNEKWMDELTARYKELCKQLVSDYSTGKLKFE